MFKNNITKENIVNAAKKEKYDYVLREIMNERYEHGYQMQFKDTNLIITFKEKENIQLVEPFGSSYAIYYTGPSVKRCFKELAKRLNAWF